MATFRRTKGAMDVGVAINATVDAMDQTTNTFAGAASSIDNAFAGLRAAIRVMNDNPNAFSAAHKSHMRQFYSVDVPNFITELHQAINAGYLTIPEPTA